MLPEFRAATGRARHDGRMNLFSLLDQAARRFAPRGAVYRGTELVLTYAELRERALRLAAGLRRRCPAGARIAVVSENRPEYLELMFGAWAAECVIVPINAKLHALEMRADRRGRRGGARLRLAEAGRGARPRDCRPRARARRSSSAGDAYAACFDATPADAAAQRARVARLALLHQRHDRPLEGRDAVAPQPDGADDRASRRRRSARRAHEPDPRRADVARLGAVRAAPMWRAARGR